MKICYRWPKKLPEDYSATPEGTHPPIPILIIIVIINIIINIVIIIFVVGKKEIPKQIVFSF